MHTAWLASEHSRIHLIEQWPDGPRKTAALVAARSALNSLLRNVSLLPSVPGDASAFRCAICGGRRNSPVMLESPARLQLTHSSELAA
jgi:hypothetical protein